jgi:sulfate-transporting ATPase
MSQFLQFALLGLGLGALYSLSAQGLIIIYRGSGVLNFAHGAVAMVAAYLCWDLSIQQGLPWALAFVIGILVAALVGGLIHLLVMRPLRKASSLSRIAATLGLLLLLQGLVVLRYGSNAILVNSELPVTRLSITSDVGITEDQLILLGVAVVITGILWVAYKYTKFGLSTSAVAESELVTASLGLSPDKIATANWAIGSALAGAAGILISPIVQLQPTTMTTLVIAALAPALIAGFRSFPVVLLAALGVGIAQTEVTLYSSLSGLGQSVPFLIIVVVLIVRGQSLPARDFFLQRLPQLGSGKIRPAVLIPVIAVSVWILLILPPAWQDTFTIFLGVSIILLSIVVLTGYTGQISLAQYTIGGLGAWLVAELDVQWRWPFLLALLVGVLVCAPIGALISLPAARTRGLSLAVATMGIGGAIELMIFDSPTLSGGAGGLDVSVPSFFGISLNPVLNPGRYAVFALALFVLAALGVANIRRGPTGRRMIAVRTNERAAAALGISVRQTKVYAFALASSIAALGGAVLAYRNDVVVLSEFTNLTSINMVAWIMVGGVGFILGPIFGAQLAPSSLGTQVVSTIFTNAADIVAPVGGLLVILFLIQGEGGLTKANMDMGKSLMRMLGWRQKPKPGAAELGLLTELRSEFVKIQPAVLEVADLTVKFGNVVAVSNLSMTVRAEKITGLIGPNGAGKTTAIDAITGFVKPTSGSMKINGTNVTGLDAAGRVRKGISRSFQSLELFEDMTVLDNLRTAADGRGLATLGKDLVWPTSEPLPQSVQAAIRQFHLEDDVDRMVSELPLGRRRLVAIARALGTQPDVLLLDEPAAGLGDGESKELARLVRSLADNLGLAILLVEHDMNFVMSVCDEIVVLDFGETICAGPPEHVRNDEATLRAYLGGEDIELVTPSGQTADHVTVADKVDEQVGDES